MAVGPFTRFQPLPAPLLGPQASVAAGLQQQEAASARGEELAASLAAALSAKDSEEARASALEAERDLLRQFRADLQAQVPRGNGADHSYDQLRAPLGGLAWYCVFLAGQLMLAGIAIVTFTATEGRPCACHYNNCCVAATPSWPLRPTR